MGMYAEILGSTVKYNSLLAVVVSKLMQQGLLISYSTSDVHITLSRTDVDLVARKMLEMFKDGSAWNEADWAFESSKTTVSINHLNRFAIDANNLAILVNWLAFTNEQSITFA